MRCIELQTTYHKQLNCIPVGKLQFKEKLGWELLKFSNYDEVKFILQDKNIQVKLNTHHDSYLEHYSSYKLTNLDFLVGTLI